MFIFNRRGFVAAALIVLLAPGAVSAADFDCAAYENYAGAEPDGYAEACIPGGPAVITNPNAPDAPTDTAFAFDLRNDIALQHQQGDLATNVVVGMNGDSLFAMDYSVDLSTLYAINFTGNILGTFDGTTLTPIAAVTGVPGGSNITGLTIDPVSGDAYIMEGGTLYSFDLGTAVATPIGPTGAALMIDIAMNCTGELYGHDIASDQIFSIDAGTGAATAIGPTGILANFAQGMDFDNESGELYIHGYTGGGTNSYGTIDLATGALTPLNVNNPLGEFEGASQTTCDGTAEGPARFQVTKDFSDDNPSEVDVVIQCNTGLPLMQPASISEGDGVTFVVGDFEDGAMNCVITEVVPDGYSVTYNNGEIFSGDSCSFEAVGAGSFNTCEISNFLDEVYVDVTKVWIDENPQFSAINYAEAFWSCENAATSCEEGVEGGAGGASCSGNLEFFGNPDTDRFYVRPSWDGGTTCTVGEVSIADGNVEIDDSDCDSIVLFPGGNGECTIYNTRLYAGIPTLSQYGLAVLVLLMLGVGLVGFRRFV